MAEDPARTIPGPVASAGPVPARQLRRSWRSILFAPVGDGQRRRRGSDGLRLAAAILAVVCCVLIIRYDSRIDRAVIQVIHPPPRSITWLVTVVYDAGAFGVTIVLVLLVLLARRWVLARDIALSAAGAAALSGILVLLLGSRGGRPDGIVIHGYSVTFPVLQIALFMAVATAGLPYLARGLQRLIEAFIALVALASAVGGHGLPVNVLGSLAIGWGVAAVVRLIFGSPLGLPSADDVQALLDDLGVQSSDVRAAARQVWGVAKYQAHDADSPGQRIGIAVYGRDAADARLLTKAGRFLFYRDSGPSLTITRLQQVEHEGYLTMRAAQAGARVPAIAEAGTAGPSSDALLVYRLPAGTMLSEADASQVSDAALADLYRQLLTLRQARIAHGAISGDTLLVDPGAETATVTDFRNATSSARPDQLDRDMAGVVAATAVAVGAQRSADAAARCLTPEVLAGALQHLHRAALDPALGRSLRGKRELLNDVRQRAAQAGAIDVPKLAEPRRVSWPTLIMIVGTLIGGWALIGVLLDVSKSFDTVIGADWLWVIVAFILSLLVSVAAAIEGIGSVAGALQFGRVLAVEIANAFSALAGGTAAVFATRVRFFQQQGYDASVALSSGAIIAASSWIATAVLFLVSLPFAWGSIHLEATPESGGDSKLVWIILAVVVLVAVVAGVAVAVPKLRRLAVDKLRPRVRSIWGNLKQVATSPRKLVLLVGGSFAQELIVAMTLSVSLRAFGDHLRLPTLIVVITLAAIIGGISPSPGGMGVVEAGMILGLTAAGVSEADATAAVFIQRLFTSYLPPIWGWFTLVWMRKREYL
jgi:glycosyltransferase 2 family protein